jgi:DNA-binding Lrp family transcriptional regulator
MSELTEVESRILQATEAGLPLSSRPFVTLSEELRLPLDTVLKTFSALLERGVIRRIAAVPNHYKMGLTANGMTVWDVDDSVVDALGEKVGALEFVSHAYRRPRHRPVWPYNLFAMVHGRSKEECEEKAAAIREILGSACQASDILYSRRILKKTGFRSGS